MNSLFPYFIIEGPIRCQKQGQRKIRGENLKENTKHREEVLWRKNWSEGGEGFLTAYNSMEVFVAG